MQLRQSPSGPVAATSFSGVDAGSQTIGAQASALISLAVPGAQPGDTCLVSMAPANPVAGLCVEAAACLAADVVLVRLGNLSAGSITATPSFSGVVFHVNVGA
jgi:hypothetical protein